MELSREYREKMRASGDNTMDDIERDVNDILSSAEDVREILEATNGLSFMEVEEEIKPKIEEIIDALEELADKLY